MAKSLAVAWGKDHINVNCILPVSGRPGVVGGRGVHQQPAQAPPSRARPQSQGAINTQFLSAVLNTPEKVDYALHRIPLGRLGVGEDLVGPALFLASEASRYVTATEVIVDGGGTSIPMLAFPRPEDFAL